jgi:hypothetical protein
MCAAGYVLEKTLEGHGIPSTAVNPEDIDALYAAMRASIVADGPAAVVCKRKMAPGVAGIEGCSHGHDAIAVKHAIPYLKARGLDAAIATIEAIKPSADPYKYEGSGASAAMRVAFGDVTNKILAKMSKEDRIAKVRVIDSDLGGSTGLMKVKEAHPEVYIQSGVMERGNFSACAGFGMEKGKQGIFSTFAAFLEMCCSEITMARLNNSNVLSHFRHAVIDMPHSDTYCRVPSFGTLCGGCSAAIRAWTTWRITRATSASTTCSPTTASTTATPPRSTSPRTCTRCRILPLSPLSHLAPSHSALSPTWPPPT